MDDAIFVFTSSKAEHPSDIEEYFAWDDSMISRSLCESALERPVPGHKVVSATSFRQGKVNLRRWS